MLTPASQAIIALEAVDISAADAIPTRNGKGLVVAWFYVGVAGDVTLRCEQDTADVLLKGLTVGWHRMRVVKVAKVGTAATNMVFGYVGL